MGVRIRVGVSPLDPGREYTPQENEQLTRHLKALLNGVQAGLFSEVPVDDRLLSALHRNIFQNVRDHAGRIRAAGKGSERLTFGPHRSAGRDEVPSQLAEVWAAFDHLLRSLEASPDHPQYEEASLRAAILLHADVIRIHPFEDGNGRTCRALMNVVLVRLGLRPILMEVPRQEYLACLNHYYAKDDSRMLELLAIELSAAVLDEPR